MSTVNQRGHKSPTLTGVTSAGMECDGLLPMMLGTPGIHRQHQIPQNRMVHGDIRVQRALLLPLRAQVRNYNLGWLWGQYCLH